MKEHEHPYWNESNLAHLKRHPMHMTDAEVKEEAAYRNNKMAEEAKKTRAYPSSDEYFAGRDHS